MGHLVCPPFPEWALLVSCLAFSTIAHTSRLMLGGEIPDTNYNSSTLVGLRHPVIVSYESSLKAYADISHIEQHSQPRNN